KFLVVLAVAVACAAADVSHIVTPDYQVPIVRSSYEINPEGNAHQYAFETGNGIYAQAEGFLRNANSDTPVYEVKGSFSYKSPDGTPVETSYVADEFGYRPTGSHIPAVPEAILRSLAYIKENTPVVERLSKP
ncbi:jg19862, partial [Pararge aegeria aegeria]